MTITEHGFSLIKHDLLYNPFGFNLTGVEGREGGWGMGRAIGEGRGWRREGGKGGGKGVWGKG